MAAWGQEQEWRARMLEALVNIYNMLEKHEKTTEEANTKVTNTFMKINFEGWTPEKPDELKPRSEPKYELWTAQDFNNMRKAIPYAAPEEVELLLKALHAFKEDQEDVDIENRKWAWKELRNKFEDTTISSQCNYSTIVIGSITSLMADFGKRTGFQAQTMDKIDHAIQDREHKARAKRETDSI